MTTSKPTKLVFFKKHECTPCKHAQQELSRVLDKHPELQKYVVILQKEEHPALVAAFELNLYPTVLIMDKDQEVSRKVGARWLSAEWWEKALISIAAA